MLDIAIIFIGVFLAQVSPGPNMMAVAAASLGTSRSAGVATAIGVATGVLIWALLFAVGVGTVLQTFPETMTAMRLIGGSYLLFLAYRSIRAAASPRAVKGLAGVSGVQVRAAYLRGLLVVLTNPKAALMWVAISMFLASSEPAAWQYLAIGAGASLSAAAIYGTYALLFSTGVAIRTYDRFFQVIDGAFGLVFGALGGRLFVDGLKELRT